MKPEKQRLEIFKMAVYVFFPIFSFLIFSNPAFFENYLKKQKKFDSPPNYDDIDALERFKAEIRRKEVDELMKQYGNTNKK